MQLEAVVQLHRYEFGQTPGDFSVEQDDGEADVTRYDEYGEGVGANCDNLSGIFLEETVHEEEVFLREHLAQSVELVDFLLHLQECQQHFRGETQQQEEVVEYYVHIVTSGNLPHDASEVVVAGDVEDPAQ